MYSKMCKIRGIVKYGSCTLESINVQGTLCHPSWKITKLGLALSLLVLEYKCQLLIPHKFESMVTSLLTEIKISTSAIMKNHKIGSVTYSNVWATWVKLFTPSYFTDCRILLKTQKGNVCKCFAMHMPSTYAPAQIKCKSVDRCHSWNFHKLFLATNIFFYFGFGSC